MKSPTTDSSQELTSLRRELKYYKSLVEAFWEGKVPPSGACVEHFIMAQEGRKRLERLRSEPALLRASGS